MRTLIDNEIHVWIIQLSHPELNPDSFLPLLSADERDRAARLHSEKAQRQQILTRGILRQLIGNYLDLPPASLRFDYNRNGKPYLGDSKISFNASHSGEIAVLAFAASGQVGIDIERIRPHFNFDRVLQRCFSAQEIALIHANASPHSAFFQQWTRKEAYIKAIGSGIFQDIPSLDIPAEWEIEPLSIGPDYVASLAHNIPATNIRIQNYDGQEATS
jgi:4'-phosphopantetheinyl transferase